MKKSGWLLIFYSVPSRPVNNRMKLWRKLASIGAVPLKGAVYILPHSEDHYEFFQWLLSEVASMEGEGAFIRVNAIETMTDDDIIALFNKHREEEYHAIGRSIDELEREVGNIRRGSKGVDSRILIDQCKKLKKDLEAIKSRDFFSSRSVRRVEGELSALEGEIKKISGYREKKTALPSIAGIKLRNTADYQGRTWATRRNPFVDRMASAWLIAKFIDRKAVFKFMDERERGGPGKSVIPFDMRGGQFTHVGDLCTFEVLLKSFGIKGKVLGHVGRIVHELDVKDGKYENAEAKGIEEILSGIRKTSRDDEEMLQRGMAVFEMLYASKTK